MNHIIVRFYDSKKAFIKKRTFKSLNRALYEILQSKATYVSITTSILTLKIVPKETPYERN